MMMDVFRSEQIFLYCIVQPAQVDVYIFYVYDTTESFQMRWKIISENKNDIRTLNTLAYPFISSPNPCDRVELAVLGGATSAPQHQYKGAESGHPSAQSSLAPVMSRHTYTRTCAASLKCCHHKEDLSNSYFQKSENPINFQPHPQGSVCAQCLHRNLIAISALQTHFINTQRELSKNPG